MLIDCDDCLAQHTEACDDCVVTFLLREGPVELDETEMTALERLADVGLAPRLRLVPRRLPPVEEAS
jgi:hypothetical protein